jgi:hypothetical protein
MYAGLQVFQKKVTQIKEQLDRVQAKNGEFINIKVGLSEIKQWASDNPNAPKYLPRMTNWEGEINYVTPWIIVNK